MKLADFFIEKFLSFFFGLTLNRTLHYTMTFNAGVWLIIYNTKFD